MNTNAEQHPDDLAGAQLLAEERARRIAAEAEAATAKAEAASAKACVAFPSADRAVEAGDREGSSFTAAGPSARRGSSNRWSCSSKNSKPTRAKMQWGLR